MPSYESMITEEERVFKIITNIVAKELFLDRTKQENRITLDKKLRQTLRANKDDVYMTIRILEEVFEIEPLFRWRVRIAKVEDLLDYVLYSKRRPWEAEELRESFYYDSWAYEILYNDEKGHDLEMYPDDCWDWKDMDPELTHDDKWDHLRIPLSVTKKIIKFWYSSRISKRPFRIRNKIIDQIRNILFKTTEHVLEEIFPTHEYGITKAPRPPFVYDRPNLPSRKTVLRYKHRVRRQNDLIVEFQKKKDEETRLYRQHLREGIENSLKKIDNSLKEVIDSSEEVIDSSEEVIDSVEKVQNSLRLMKTSLKRIYNSLEYFKDFSEETEE